MPTSNKPRKARAAPRRNVAPGQIWPDLIALHQNCLSLLQSGAAAAPILKDPTFIENTTNIARVTEVARTIASKLPVYHSQLQEIKQQGDGFRGEWNNLNEQLKNLPKRTGEDADRLRAGMDNIQFAALSVGEGYQSWIAQWHSDVAVDIVELLQLIEETRKTMEAKQNAG